MKISYINNYRSSVNNVTAHAPISAPVQVPVNAKSTLPNYKNYSSYLVNFNGIDLTKKDVQKKERCLGCFVGGAIGDALGAKIEAYSYDKIQEKFGTSGLKYLPKTHGEYEVTDDTQMTLFTAEGLLKNYLLHHNLDDEPDYEILYESYLAWHNTQVSKSDAAYFESGLAADPSMYKKRAPGLTCMTALAQGTPGTIENPVNNSFGNGGIMRSAPIGLLYKNPDLAFKVAAKATALTHGHPDAYLSAGYFASLISMLMAGEKLETAIEQSNRILIGYDNYENVLENVNKALELSKTEGDSVKIIENKFGKGVNGAEALGIALYSVLRTPKDFKKTVITAVNHSGDSDTTGAIAGNISGILNGIRNIPPQWSENIEHLDWYNKYSSTIATISDDGCTKQIYGSSNILERWDEDKFS